MRAVEEPRCLCMLGVKYGLTPAGPFGTLKCLDLGGRQCITWLRALERLEEFSCEMDGKAGVLELMCARKTYEKAQYSPLQYGGVRTYRV